MTSLAPLLDKLRLAKIVFHDARSAAEHLNDIWENPELWWNSVGGDDCTRSFYYAGVCIAKGSVVGAGAVVTKNTEPYSIFCGVLARKIGERT